ncbi:defensin-like protein 156 [Jatropha curcas]|uniref:defensin-like protein 156 n=1 Tax=Jatropha curcas TaxID=180498 RepID=UPI0005FAE7EC|nr:defensin-like protein 156 [Jatropha curcas]
MMANLSFNNFFILFLIISVSSMVPQARAQKKCQEVLHEIGCVLEDCKKECYEKHNENGGVCIPNQAKEDYSCYCFWTCG